jgi:hypothetical protein
LVGVDKLEYIDQAVAACTASPMKAADRALYAVNDAPDSPDAAALAHGGLLYEADTSCGKRDKA